MKDMTYQNPIPKRPDPMLCEKVNFIRSEFVEIVTNDCLDVQMQYPKMGVQNAEEKCLVRREVYERLLMAARFLPKGYKLRILDAWRPFGLQEELYEKYAKEISVQHNLENLPEEERKAIILRFISEPSENRKVPPVHTTGGAVDVTVLDANGMELNMGTAFDVFSEDTQTDFFEMREVSEIRDNRRILYHAMINAGFTNLPSEWWHYDYGDRFWAHYNGASALYKGVFTREEIHGNE